MGIAPAASSDFFARKQRTVARFGIAFVQEAVGAIITGFVFRRFFGIHFFGIDVVLQGDGVRVCLFNHIACGRGRGFGGRSGFSSSCHGLRSSAHGHTSGGDLHHEYTARSGFARGHFFSLFFVFHQNILA